MTEHTGSTETPPEPPSNRADSAERPGVAPPVKSPEGESPLKTLTTVAGMVVLVIAVFWVLQFLLAALGLGGG